MAIRILDSSTFIEGRVRPTLQSFSTAFLGESSDVANVDGAFNRALGQFDARFTSSAIKWHPGHYMEMPGLGDPNQIPSDAQLDEVAASPGLRGIQQIFRWVTLESIRDGYNLSAIQNLYNRCAVRGLYLIVQIQAVKFGSTSWGNYLPSYLDTDYSPSGIFAGDLGGGDIRSMAKVWRTEIMDRKIALINEIGAQFDGGRYFEGIVLGETSLGMKSSIDPLYSGANYSTELIRALNELRNGSVKVSNLWTYFNYTDQWSTAQQQALCDAWVTYKAGGGGPDAIVNNSRENKTTGDQFFLGELGTTVYAGQVAYNLAVQDPELGGKEGTWYPADLAYSAITLKKCTHMPWIRANYTTVTWDNDILPYLNGTPLQTVQTPPTSFGNVNTS